MIDYSASENSRKNCTKYLTMVTNRNCMGHRLGGHFEVALNDFQNYFFKTIFQNYYKYVFKCLLNVTHNETTAF